jgi:hypothetical protein
MTTNKAIKTKMMIVFSFMLNPINLIYFLFQKLRLIVIHDRDINLFNLLLADINWGSRRKADFSYPFLESLLLHVSPRGTSNCFDYRLGNLFDHRIRDSIRGV